MRTEDIHKLLEEVRNGNLPVDEAMARLRTLPYENLEYAQVDHHRALRQGFPEVIFCEGKQVDQVEGIARSLLEKNADILATRVSPEQAEALQRMDGRVVYNPRARTAVLLHKAPEPKGKVLVVSAGTSDIPVAEEAKVTAETLGSAVESLYDVGVAGIHRLFHRKETIFSARVLIVVAGMDGALASVVGGMVDKPVVAVPTSVGYGAAFGGISALLAMLNSCASGVTVVNIDNGFGAGVAAHRINILSAA
ncbi:MAG: nickel pincer cofactor biosynthesis protein LarB [Nitrospirota bacterium]|nr:nickel pincer cofactor biosynthesis protein LarB [Nitrospirota bacterium]